MLLLVSGPSGAGKSTFVDALLKTDPRVVFSVSTTTRPIRGDETDGVQNHFVTPERFDELVAADAFIEWADVHDHRYGTRRDHVQGIIEAGGVPLLDLDVQGGKAVINLYGDDLVSVFIFPPSWEVLEERLRRRATDTADVIDVRLRNARWEIDYAKYYDYCIINNDLNVAIGQMRAILTAELCRTKRVQPHTSILLPPEQS